MPVATFLNGRAPTRGLLWLSLTETGKVLTRKSESDEGGGSKDTYTAGESIPCRIDPLGGGEGELADRVSDRSTHVVTLHAQTKITLNDDFEIVGLGRFEITAIRARTGEMARMVEVTNQT